MKPSERIYLKYDELNSIEKDILVRRHIERYSIIRQWCKGVVLDFACGCGYGSYVISKNPDVSFVFGLDIDKDSISWANENYKTEKIIFFQQTLEDFNEKVDLLVCLETIEHIKDKNFLPKQVNRLGINKILLSFPSKKTTHYNPYHFHDYKTQDVLDLFSDFELIDEIDLNREVKILNLLRKLSQ